MTLEVERKYRIANAAEIQKRVANLGGRWESPIVQSDRYYAHPARDFAATDEALRIRSVGDAHAVTYKGPKIDRESKTREEIEIALGGGPTSAEQMGKMLERLGFRTVWTVVKSRTLAEVAFQGRQVEIALDEVTGAGQFVELETQAEAADLEAAKECIRQLAAELGLSEADQERRSYLELVIESSRK
jgi:adenylate cyclase class 2